MGEQQEITDEKDKTNLSYAAMKRLGRHVDSDLGEQVEEQFIDTGEVTSDGLRKYVKGVVPVSPLPSSIKKSPYIGLASVAGAGTAESLCQMPIASATIATDVITIARDWTDFITVGDSLVIYGSTGNDGTYTVVSVTFATGVTSIEFESGDITDATADGKVTFAEMIVISAVVQANPTNTGSIYLGDSYAASGLGIELTAGEFAILEAGPYPIDLVEHYIDAAVNGEGVTWYILG